MYKKRTFIYFYRFLARYFMYGLYGISYFFQIDTTFGIEHWWTIYLDIAHSQLFL